ncbi:MAG: NADH-quinone oxidoreductase subunit NuoE [Gammaproteobacteria bacterium]|nr:NADH-quinone oxidoreductase subunit NuoE [Gammaproteobacteria bacterium]MYA37003.1 NADH-quinone oxidoreductase subunit NuoE [Gammaproteobacteria bacterium]MYH84821.1 NADH-quinone oxidoreductase subunit NuoE [Gammaproteobacteria bacterium]MYK04082.1 NADH-quinone oxidoreductase subunit NuoE [Gammaproteobacteria bacterium]
MSERLIASTALPADYLNEEEIAEIEHERTLYPDTRAVGLEALKIVQKHRGWVSDESLLAVAEYLGLPVAELEGVATFFNLIYRQPVGRNVILYCKSVSCWIMGCDEVKEKISGELGIDYGETSEDGEFTLIPVPCLGDCDRAPVMMVGPDQHRNLDEKNLGEIFARYRKGRD